MKVRGALLLVSLVMLGVTVSLTQPAQAQAVNREWSGDENNNWGNSKNWKNGGAANNSNENAIFDYTGSNRSIDLEGRSFDVFNIVFNLVNPNDATRLKSYDFGSNSNGAGKILIHGDMTVNAITGETVIFRTDAHLEQSAAGTWTNNGGEVIVNTKLSGTAGLTLAGDFTFSSPDNIYSGQLSLQSGTTTIAEANAFQYATVQMGGTNVLNITSSDGSANFAALLGTGNFDLGGYSLTFGSSDASTSYTGVISGGGTLNKTGTGTWTIGAANMFSGTLNVQNGTVKLVQNGSGTGQSTALALSTVNINVNNGLNVNGNDATLGALTGTGNLNLGATTLTVGANNASTAYSGVISGSSGSLVKTGIGNFTLSGASTYSGNTTIQGGSLSISAANNLGNGSELRLDHGTLITNGSFTLNRNISQSNLNGTSSTIQVNGSGNTIAVSGGISGIANLALHKTGDGGLRLNQSGTYAGEVEIDAGAIIIGDTNALRNATMHVNVNDGIDMVDGGVDATFAGLTGSGNINNGGHTITINGNFNETYSGILSGSGGLTKLGQGDLTLSAANTFTGDTKIGSDNLIDGKVILGNANALKNSTVYINTDNRLDINGFNANLGALGGSGNLNLGATSLTAGGNGATTTYSGTISGNVGGNATLKKVGAGTLTLTGTVNNLYELWATNNGQLILSGADVNLLQISGTDYHSPGAKNGAEVVISNGSTVVSAGAVAHSSAENNGTLRIQDPGTSLTTGNLGAAWGNASVLIQNGALATVTQVLYAGALSAPANAIGSVIVESGGRVEGSADGLFGQDPGDEGTLTITGVGSTVKLNELRLGGKATSPGGTGTAIIKDGGALTVNGAIKLWTTASSLTVDGGTCSVDTLFNDTGATPTINLSDAISATQALTVGVSGGNSTFDGLIQDATGGPGSIMKTGTGTFAFTGANTFTGGVTVAGGTLLVSNTTGSATGAGAVTVNTGGTLGGTGSAAGLTTVASGGTVAPGASAGVLTLGNVTFNAGSKLAIQIGGTSPGSGHDQLVVNNTATLGGTLDLAYIDPFTITPGQSFVILTAGTLTGTFDAVNYPDGQNWSITYDTDAGTVTVGSCADCDGDGVCDDDDLCPGTPSGALVDANGCAIPAPTILGWASVRTHGNNVGDLAIDLNANGSRLPTTEPRRDGIRKIVVTFSEAVEAVDGTLDTNDVVVFGFDNGAQVPTSLSLDGGATGTVLTINFADGLPDDEIYGFNLAGKFKSAATALLLNGDTDAEVANYEGDARDTAPSTESIDILDLQAIKIAILGGAAPTARTDLNPDGQLNIIDMVFVKKNLGNLFPAP